MSIGVIEASELTTLYSSSVCIDGDLAAEHAHAPRPVRTRDS